MINFIKKTSLFAFFIVIFIGTCEVLIRSNKDNMYSYKHTYIIENGNNINTLIFGNSHGFFGVMPQYLNQPAFNLANDSQPIRMDYGLLQNYMKYLDNLETVIITVSYGSLRGSGWRLEKSAIHKVKYSLYMDANIENKYTYNFAISSPKFFITGLKSFFRPNEILRCNSLGWGTSYHIDNKRTEWEGSISEAAIKRHTNSHTEYLSVNISCLENMIVLCKENNIRPIIITAPTWHSYYDNLDKTQYDEMQNTIKNIQSKYNIEYYNFIKDSRFEADDFYDGDHLSNIGAEKFTKILADTLGI